MHLRLGVVVGICARRRRGVPAGASPGGGRRGRGRSPAMSGPLRGRGAGALPALGLLLLLLLLGSPATPGITCPTPTSVEHADIQVKNYSINSRERYVCNSGFKRKAGTSSLTQCVFNETAKVAHWTTPNLKCISAYQHNPSVVTAVSIPVAVVFAVCLVFLLVRCLMSRRAHQTPGVEMESMESVPMTTGADARGEDTETHLYGLGGSGDAEASSRGEGPALPQPERT